MSQNRKTRSTLTIDAVAQAAATGVAQALNPLRKPANITGLAGFVLRLFRTREQLPPLAGREKGPARIQEGSKRAVRRQPATSAADPAGPVEDGLASGADRKGGLRHG